jgi:hypothetical protein
MAPKATRKTPAAQGGDATIATEKEMAEKPSEGTDGDGGMNVTATTATTTTTTKTTKGAKGAKGGERVSEREGEYGTRISNYYYFLMNSG